jgi:hypothetical protein
MSMDRRSLTVGFLAGGWAATLALLIVPALRPAGLFRSANAEEPPGLGGNFGPNGPNNPKFPEPKSPYDAQIDPRGSVPPSSANTSDSNNVAIALSASISGGQSAVWYFDTAKQRVLVYQYMPGGKGGLKLLAARHIDYDLKLEAYNDVSDKLRRELKEDYDEAFAGEKPSPKKNGELPTKKIDVPGGGK